MLNSPASRMQMPATSLRSASVRGVLKTTFCSRLLRICQASLGCASWM